MTIKFWRKRNYPTLCTNTLRPVRRMPPPYERIGMPLLAGTCDLVRCALSVESLPAWYYLDKDSVCRYFALPPESTLCAIRMVNARQPEFVRIWASCLVCPSTRPSQSSKLRQPHHNRTGIIKPIFSRIGVLPLDWCNERFRPATAAYF
jgi:hypothetical protein